MTIESSPLIHDIRDIMQKPDDKYSSGFDCELKLHTTDRDLDHTDGLIITTIRILRDYVGKVSDYIEVDISCLLGTYVYDVYPYMDNIEVSLYLTRQERVNNKPNNITERYKGVYLLERNTAIPTKSSRSKDDLNQNLPIVFTLQLLDRSVETLRIKTLQGSFDRVINPKNKLMSPGPLMKSLISEQVNKVLIENKPAIDKVSIEPPDNEGDFKSLTVPSGTRLVELTEYLQTNSDGVYNAGIGTYIQRFASSLTDTSKVYFVYSVYKAKKYDTSEHKIIFYSPPTSNYSTTDVTYKYQDKVLKVLAHSSTRIDDTKESLVMSSGSGYRVANANSYMRKPVEITEQGPKFVKSRLNTEVTYKDRSDGLNFSPVKGVVSNHFEINSEILAKAGKYIELTVSNLDMDFIYPGAACKIVYEGKTGGVEEVFGVIHRAHITLAQPAMNMTHLYNSPTVTLNSQMTLEVFVNGE